MSVVFAVVLRYLSTRHLLSTLWLPVALKEAEIHNQRFSSVLRANGLKIAMHASGEKAGKR